MSFFDSEFVRSEMVEISELQEDIYGNVFKFPSMSKEDKIKHVELLEKLLSKQQTLYTRLSLSDDPEAKDDEGAYYRLRSRYGYAERMLI